MNFVAGTLTDFADPVTAVACDIDLVIEVVAGLVRADSEPAAKNCLETHLADKLIEVRQMRKSL
ncbi:MAG: hypothetical protein EXR90_00175 [Methyloglobulus sp.]|nr:hypothetical protein [Pseudomonadota bacterium]MSS75349.1 hypothetical protein [Methyloglobulus sp.]